MKDDSTGTESIPVEGQKLNRSAWQIVGDAVKLALIFLPMELLIALGYLLAFISVASGMATRRVIRAGQWLGGVVRE